MRLSLTLPHTLNQGDGHIQPKSSVRNVGVLGGGRGGYLDEQAPHDR